MNKSVSRPNKPALKQIGLYENRGGSIAGHALSQGCILVTNNMGEFARVAGLKVEDWV